MNNTEKAGDIILTLRSAPSSIPLPSRLKRLLKTALRSFSFRVVALREVPGEQPPSAVAGSNVQDHPC